MNIFISKRESFVLATILIVMSFSFADVPDNVDSLVTFFLESYNQLEGIELLGGPFELDAYTSETQTYSTSENQYIDYKYCKNGSTKGWPSKFSVWIHSGISSPLSMSTGPVVISEKTQKALEKCGINTNELPNLKNYSMPSQMAVIQIGSDGGILRKDGKIDSINRIAECKDNDVCVFYNEGYSSSLFRSLLHTRNFILSDIEDFGNADNKEIIDNDADISLPDIRFLLFGQIEDTNLLSLIKKHYQAHPDFKILAIKITSENKALLFEGDLDIVTKWFISRPIVTAVLEKNECWGISKTIEILNIDEFFLDIPIQIFPLTPKLNKKFLSEIKKDVKLDTKLDEVEIMELIHYAYRLRGISNNILSIKDIGTMEVEIRLGSYTAGSAVKFKKVNGKWLISGYFEYII